MSMPSDTPNAPPPGLPTVTPPSGGMFLRLFGVPALIVGGLVVVLILAQPLLSKASRFFLGRSWGSSSPEQFLRDLDNPNKEVRWRAASDLAQVLLRDDDLASDSAFALQLTQRLRHVVDSSATFEKAFADQAGKRSPRDQAADMAKLEPDRDYVLLLTQCLGHFLVPVGAPILEELAVQESGIEPKALNARRRQALWALANLGENVKRFDNLSAERQDAVKTQLESAAGEGQQASAARSTLDFLTRRQEGRPSALGVDRVVEKCADADDPAVREMAAFVVNFWSGSAAENARMEKVLVRLSYDAGKGEDELRQLEEQREPDAGGLFGRFIEKEPTRSLVKKPGFRVQANATVALARMGSNKVRLDMLQTMLDEEELRGIFVVQSKKTNQEAPDEAAVVETLLNALKAVAELHRKNASFDLSSLRPALDRLAHNANPAVSTEAGLVVLALGGK
jgi:hypothetical protein